MNMALVWKAAAIGLGVWGADFVLDTWIIRSDSGDPRGFITQSEGFGVDDVVRLVGQGLGGVLGLKLLGRG